jgi:uncharacterized protein (DUF1778 family)
MQAQLQKIERDERFDVRVPQHLKEAVLYAANLQGLNLSDFIIAAIANEAGRVINENHVIRLTLRDQQKLLDALSAPAKEPTAKAKAAAIKYKKNVENGRIVIQH